MCSFINKEMWKFVRSIQMVILIIEGEKIPLRSESRDEYIESY